MALNKPKEKYVVNEETFTNFIDNHDYNQEDAAIRIPVSLFRTMLERIAAKYTPVSSSETNLHVKTMLLKAIEEAWSINQEAIELNYRDKEDILPVYESVFNEVYKELDNRRIISELLTTNQ